KMAVCKQTVAKLRLIESSPDEIAARKPAACPGHILKLHALQVRLLQRLPRKLPGPDSVLLLPPELLEQLQEEGSLPFQSRGLLTLGVFLRPASAAGRRRPAGCRFGESSVD